MQTNESMSQEASLPSASTSSTTTNQPSSTPSICQDIIDADPILSDSRLSAIFASGLIYEEQRLNPTDIVTHKPSVYLTSCVEKSREQHESFSSATTQRKVYTEAAKDRTVFRYAGQTFKPREGVFLTDYLQKQSDRPAKTIRTGNIQIVLPNILRFQLESVTSAVLCYQRLLLNNLDAHNFAMKRSIDHGATLSCLREKAEEATRLFSKVEERRILYKELFVTRVLELLNHQHQHEFLCLLKYRTPTEHQLTKGMFVADTNPRAREYPPTNLIPDGVLGVAVQTTYNLNTKQIGNLLDVCFSRNPRTRATSKIELLSSLNPSIRNDVILEPTRVLERAFIEHLLDREEILAICFPTPDSKQQPRAMKCVHCDVFIQLATDGGLVHPTCPVTKWLERCFGFQHTDGYIETPSLQYLAPPIAPYARELLRADAQNKLEPYICSTDESMRIVSLESNGQARTLAQQGPKLIRMKPP